jgi:hypothetical protein
VCACVVCIYMCVCVCAYTRVREWCVCLHVGVRVATCVVKAGNLSTFGLVRIAV